MSNESEFETAVRKIGKYRDAIEEQAMTTLREIAEEIITDVKTSGPGRGVPVDEGTLRNSLRVLKRGGYAVDLVAGGAAAPYALVQHERTDFRHRVGEARYLVRGVERWQPGGSAAIAALRANAQFAAQRAAEGGY